MNKSIILNTDSYKCSQWTHYPPNTEYVYSYIESRGGKFENSVFFGLQGFLKEYLTKPITRMDIDVAESIITKHGEPFNREGWEYILEQHGGYFPLKIQAVPEGSVIPVKNVLVALENTDPKCYWLTSYIETALLRGVWYPTTIATNSFCCRELIMKSLEKTSFNVFIDFMLHDFGSRGVSSFESSGIAGAAHLLSFLGTDNINSIQYCMEYYNSDVVGFSVPATEHSCITSWGKGQELNAYRNILRNHKDNIVSIVSDSYDVFEACRMFGTELKEEILNRNHVFVVRLDSGDPLTIVLECTKILEQYFGSYVNDRGYKVLNGVKILQGDGIDYDEIGNILNGLEENRYSASNIVFGSGGALLQKFNRDTMKFAMKCSAIKVNGEWRGVFKDPVTDPGKKSKIGRVTLYKNREGYHSGVEDWQNPVLRTVYENGKLIIDESFNDIRKRLLESENHGVK